MLNLDDNDSVSCRGLSYPDVWSRLARPSNARRMCIDVNEKAALLFWTVLILNPIGSMRGEPPLQAVREPGFHMSLVCALSDTMVARPDLSKREHLYSSDLPASARISLLAPTPNPSDPPRTATPGSGPRRR